MAQVNAIGIYAAQAAPFAPTDLYIDVVMLNGESRLSNDGISTVPLSKVTEYHYSELPQQAATQPQYDFDNDRQADWVVVSGAQTSVYLDGKRNTDASGDPVDPDLTRVTDKPIDTRDQGLLKTISHEDFKDTELYIYRVSTGQLITKVKGVNDNQVIAQGSRQAYRVMIPGPAASHVIGSPNVWQEQEWPNDELKGTQADYLKPGEQVKLIAINRPTGYIGSVTTTIQAPSNGMMDFPIEPIVMRPPNLKLKVERVYRVDAGLFEGDEREYQVGFEGSALTSDTRISVYTEWLDQDGSPLPDKLEGYTGRLAKVTAPNSLEGGSVANFSIKPGKQMQVIKFEGDILGTEHFYVHVSGYPSWRNPGVGAGAGPLQYRPKNYVPVKVPLFDEVATRELRLRAGYAFEDGLRDNRDVDAVYHWPYRPEMQFSAYEFVMQEIRRTDSEGNSSNILVDGNSLVQEDQQLGLIYNLLDSEFDMLQTFGTGRELVFEMNGNELLAQMGSDGRVTFSDLHRVEAEAFLSIRLLDNGDAENILWEYQAPTPRIAADFNRDGKIEWSAQLYSDPEHKIRTDRVTLCNPLVIWINDDDDDNGSETRGNANWLTLPMNGSDKPGATFADHSDDEIDGTRDLIDFFPVALNLQAFFATNPDLDSYRVVLRHADEALNLIQTDMTLDNSDFYLNELDVDDPQALFGDWQAHGTLMAEVVKPITQQGVVLDRAFLEAIKAGPNKGVILIEGAKTSNKPLELLIEKLSGEKILNAQLPIKIVSVLDMYRHVSILGGDVPGEVLPIEAMAEDLITQQQNLVLPDTKNQQKHFVFVHGFSVTPDSAVEFQTETFKRMFHSGSNAIFTGVTWRGDEGWINGINYWTNVENAFEAADDFATLIKSSSNGQQAFTGEISIAAHSLGNMVLGSAIQDYKLRPDYYFMLDPAVATEAYEPGGRIDSNMIDAEWEGFIDNRAESDRYSHRLFSSMWYRLFATEEYTNDPRADLRWQGRFSTLADPKEVKGVIQYFSSTEDVLQPAKNQDTPWLIDNAVVTWESGRDAWNIQEKTKGTLLLTSLFGDITPEGGWGFNCCIPRSPDDPDDMTQTDYRDVPPAETWTWDDSRLRTNPLFKKFEGSGLFDEQSGSSEAERLHGHLLGYAIPAMSFAAGGSAMEVYVDRQVDMSSYIDGKKSVNSTELAEDERWPKERDERAWWHSDFKQVAYLYVHQIFNSMTQQGNLR